MDYKEVDWVVFSSPKYKNQKFNISARTSTD